MAATTAETSINRGNPETAVPVVPIQEKFINIFTDQNNLYYQNFLPGDKNTLIFMIENVKIAETLGQTICQFYYLVQLPDIVF